MNFPFGGPGTILSIDMLAILAGVFGRLLTATRLPILLRHALIVDHVILILLHNFEAGVQGISQQDFVRVVSVEALWRLVEGVVVDAFDVAIIARCFGAVDHALILIIE